MWLLIIMLAAVIATAVWYTKDDGKYGLGVLCMILWGTAVMVFVDHLMGFLSEGGEFIEMTADALILGVVMVIAALLIWEAFLILSDPLGKLRGNLRKGGGE